MVVTTLPSYIIFQVSVWDLGVFFFSAKFKMTSITLVGYAKKNEIGRYDKHGHYPNSSGSFLFWVSIKLHNTLIENFNFSDKR